MFLPMPLAPNMVQHQYGCNASQDASNNLTGWCCLYRYTDIANLSWLPGLGLPGILAVGYPGSPLVLQHNDLILWEWLQIPFLSYQP